MRFDDSRSDTHGKSPWLPSFHLFFTCLVLALVAHFPADAQTSTEDCTGQPSLGFDDTFSFNTLPSPQSDDFALTGAGCFPWDPSDCGFNDGFDRVVCFTPTNDCEIVVQVATGGNGGAVHVFSGMCGEPTSCVASMSDNGAGATLSSVLLTAGSPYCVVAERCGTATMNFFINQIGGTDCGPLGPDPLIFMDGFESGDTTSWSSSVP